MKLVSVTLADSKEDLIGDALASVVDWVDHCLVIDTGIEDRTADVALETVGEWKLVMDRMDWPDDFSIARNAALDIAKIQFYKEGDEEEVWAIMLDTDERIDFNGDDIRPLIENRPDKNTSVFMMWSHDKSYCKERIFKIPARGRYTGPTHEAFPAQEYNPVTLEKAYFNELEKTQDQLIAKWERDAKILAWQVLKTPHDPRWWFYLGESLAGLGNVDMALETYQRCAKLRGWPEESAWACYKAAECFIKKGELDKALSWCIDGMERHAGMGELPWLAGYICFQMGRLENACYWARMAITLGRTSGNKINRIGFHNPSALYEGPYDILRHAHKRLGEEELASVAEKNYTLAKAMRLGQSIDSV